MRVFKTPRRHSFILNTFEVDASSAFERLGADPVWFGILTVIAVEVGRLTPHLGRACFAIKGCLDDERITLGDVFVGVAPFALMMDFVIAPLTAWPDLAYINRWFG